MNTLLSYNNASWIDMQNIPQQQVKFYDFHDDETPVYSTHELGAIKEGVSFSISGFMPLNCERFAIHLVLNNPNRDIALRVNPRLPQNYVVRNSRVKFRWGADEDASTFRFNLHRGTSFVVQIVVTHQRYMISLNHIHFAKYKHRVPYNSLSCIEVYGEVNNVHVERCEVTEYPPKFVRMKTMNETGICGLRTFSRFSELRSLEQSLTLPYYCRIPKKAMDSTKHIRIEGRVKILPLTFYVNLQSDHNIWPHPIVALQFRCRFAKHSDYIGKNVIVRNAWDNGRWGYEEISELGTELCPAKNFSLVIVRKLTSYEIFVNRRFIAEFKYRVDPDIANTVYVLGDVKLWDVVLEDHIDSEFYHKQEGLSFVEFLRSLL